MIAGKNGNNRGWRTVQTVVLILSLGFLFIDKIVMPSVNSGKLADTVNAQGKQVAVLEDVIVSLRPLPVEVAALKESLAGVKKTLDRIEGNLNGGKDKR
jgi:hypothetical protein